MAKFTEFFSDDAGAITIDWLVLTAGILLLSIMILYTIFNNGVSTMTSNLNPALAGEGATVVIGTIE